MATVFFLSQETRQPNPNLKIAVFYILCTRFTMDYKTDQKNFHGSVAPRPPKGLSISAPAWACQPKPPLHGLNLKKSLIKNHATLFRSGRVVKPNQIKLGSTKPNINILKCM